jgi:hypothetical protein
MTNPIDGMDIAALAAQAAEQDDFTQSESGGFDRELPSEGPCFVRLREYVEMGDHKPTEWKIKAYGKSKPKPRARWTFEIVAAIRKDPETGERINVAHREITPDGKDAFKVAETVTITTDISKNEKSGHFLLFAALNAAYGGTFAHPAQMLDGKGWKARIVHGYAKDDCNKEGVPKEGAVPAYVNLRNKQGWTFGAPVKEDPETGDVVRLKVPELIGGLGTRRIFLWASPNQACWDSLFIDGEKDEMKDGKATGKKVSKNWLQETILTATDYKGSALEVLLADAGGLDDLADEMVDTPKSAGAEEEDPLAEFDDDIAF